MELLKYFKCSCQRTLCSNCCNCNEFLIKTKTHALPLKRQGKPNQAKPIQTLFMPIKRNYTSFLAQAIDSVCARNSRKSNIFLSHPQPQSRKKETHKNCATSDAVRGRDTLKIVWVGRRVWFICAWTIRLNMLYISCYFPLVINCVVPIAHWAYAWCENNSRRKRTYPPACAPLWGITITWRQFTGPIFMASLLVFMRPHTQSWVRESGVRRRVGSDCGQFCGGAHSIKYWGSFIFVFLFNYGLHVLSDGLSVCLCQIKLLG